MAGSPIGDRVPFCEHGNVSFIGGVLIARLRDLENVLSFDLHYNSGFRCPSCNRVAGGKPNSAHLRGLAVDVSAPDSNTRFRIVQGALKVGFRRVGVGKSFVHLDCDESLPANMLWIYT